jgi:adenosylmethionine-8-amino-7-oxononanoate aminotransferase
MNLSERDFQVLFHPFTVFHADGRNLPVTGGKDEFLFLEDGTRLLDAVSSWWLNLHGHNHPYINQKIKEQLDRLEHVIFAGFTHEPAVALAERLLEKGGPSFRKVFLSDNGSTAVEVALKMAIQFFADFGKSRSRIIAFRNSYHGDTFGSMSVSERDLFVKPFQHHLFDVDFVDVPTPGNREAVFRQFSDFLSSGPAAFIFEPLVQGAGGMRMYDASDLDELISMARESGVLTIADEVMTGFYRTGTYFASDRLAHKPDLICLSKGLTGGYLPLGATLVSRQVAEKFETPDAHQAFYHGHSFTGNPISCTAALASMDLLEKVEIRNQIKNRTEQFERWTEKARDWSFADNPRCMGGIFAFDFRTKETGYFYTDPIKKKLYDYFLGENILIRPMGNVVYVMPPYCTGTDSLQRIWQALENLKDLY